MGGSAFFNPQITVQDLIGELEKVEDKTLPVIVFSTMSEDGNWAEGKVELQELEDEDTLEYHQGDHPLKYREDDLKRAILIK